MLSETTVYIWTTRISILRYYTKFTINCHHSISSLVFLLYFFFSFIDLFLSPNSATYKRCFTVFGNALRFGIFRVCRSILTERCARLPLSPAYYYFLIIIYFILFYFRIDTLYFCCLYLYLKNL